MKKTDPDEHAFPGSALTSEGITKREYFAGIALKALASTPASAELTAQACVRCADALIKELNKTD